MLGGAIFERKYVFWHQDIIYFWGGSLHFFYNLSK